MTKGSEPASNERRRAAGLCADCRHARPVESSKGSVFSRCALAETDPRFAKYPHLPVLSCPGFDSGQEMT